MGIRFKSAKKSKKVIIGELRQENVKVQHALDILIAADEARSGYVGNPYTSYSSAVEALAKKYEGTASWGVQQARNIIDVRSAFIVGRGLNVKSKNGSESRELEFIKAFIENNDLDEEMPQEFAKEAEIEGKFLCQLTPNEVTEQIDLRYVSWTTNRYTVVASNEDYKRYEEVVWKVSRQSTEVKLTTDEFVYKKFGGRVNKVNDVMPKVSMINKQIEDLDKALWDWRKINNLFASPTPHLKVEDQNEALSVYNTIKDRNWKVGKLLISTGEFSLVGADMQGATSIEQEITTLVKVVSGATGVPVHFLGLPDLMSNRAVSTDLFELIQASTARERKVWVGAYEEVFKKVLKMANKTLHKGFNIDAIDVDIPQFTSSEMQALVDVWLPLYMADVVDLNYILSMIPNVDVDAMKRSQTDNAKQILDSMKKKEVEAEKE